MYKLNSHVEYVGVKARKNKLSVEIKNSERLDIKSAPKDKSLKWYSPGASLGK